MLKKPLFSVLLAAVASGAFAQSNIPIPATPEHSAYLQDSRGIIVRSPFGLCWRTGYWTPADAVAGCDGVLAPPIAKPIAPPIAPPVVVASAPPAVPAPLPKPCDFSITLDNDQAFAFNRTALNSAAKRRLEAVLSGLNHCARVDAITVTGHADRLGTGQYNRKLSEKRASAVAAYLRSKGVSTPIDAVGAGETQPVKTCDNGLARTRLIACLAPNRRVVIEVHGVAKQ